MDLMNRFTQPLIIIGLTCFATGCTPTIDNRGYEKDNIDFSSIKVGVHNQDHVMRLLGSPSTTSTFDPPVWYYATKVTATTSFFMPKVLDQNVTAIVFDKQGIVREVKTVDSSDFKDITPNKKATETTGLQSGMMREIFSNFGKISAKRPQV
jgi:outer membrane protein assembly factor BamE (lipoprotein component of BamABCDE complex)